MGIRFADFIFAQTKTPDEFSKKLKGKMASDSFWDSAASAKVKDGVWKPKKLKGSRLRRKKKGSRIGTLEKRATVTPKKDGTESGPTSPRSASPMKDRISQWEGN